MRCRCLRQHILTSGNERIKVHSVCRTVLHAAIFEVGGSRRKVPGLEV